MIFSRSVAADAGSARHRLERLFAIGSGLPPVAQAGNAAQQAGPAQQPREVEAAATAVPHIPTRLAMSGPAAAGLVVVLLLGLLLGVQYLWRAQPEAIAVPIAESSGVAAAESPLAPSSESTPTTTAQVLLVHVAGKVKRPGLVRVKPGARVEDAVLAAGGPSRGADLSSVNLARPVADGEQLVVLARGAGPIGAPLPSAPSGAALGSAGPGGALDLNSATAAQLEELSGVGPVLSERIIAWRTENGRFSSVDELQEVEGIGEKKFAALSALVRV